MRECLCIGGLLEGCGNCLVLAFSSRGHHPRLVMLLKREEKREGKRWSYIDDDLSNAGAAFFFFSFSLSALCLSAIVLPILSLSSAGCFSFFCVFCCPFVAFIVYELDSLIFFSLPVLNRFSFV